VFSNINGMLIVEFRSISNIIVSQKSLFSMDSKKNSRCNKIVKRFF